MHAVAGDPGGVRAEAVRGVGVWAAGVCAHDRRGHRCGYVEAEGLPDFKGARATSGVYTRVGVWCRTLHWNVPVFEPPQQEAIYVCGAAPHRLCTDV